MGRRPDPERIRTAACEVVGRLVDAGHVAYFAGGCVRDRLMGADPIDYDVATGATPTEIKTLFPSAYGVGEAFGVMLVRRSGFTIEVATFRTDGVYADGRHPSEVCFTDAEHDASRRDFTINGIFEDPLNDEIIDYVGGRDDLEGRLVRAIGEPVDRLREDQLRMLRAVRFASRFSFTIEPTTAEAIREGAHELRGVSRERIGQEVRWMLRDPNRAVAAWEMQYLELDVAVLDEPHRLVAPRRLARLPEEAEYPTALAAWLLDRDEEPDAPNRPPRERAAAWARALVLSNAERSGVLRALRVYQLLHCGWWGSGVASQKRLAASEGFQSGLQLIKAEDVQAFVDVQRRVSELQETDLAPPPLIDGGDLISEGLRPGPMFARVLEAVYDAQLEGSIRARGDAIQLARAIVASEQTGT